MIDSKQFVVFRLLPKMGQDPQAMERQGLLQAFVQALHRRAVEQLKLFAKPPERPLGPLASGLIISRLEFPPDAPLPALGQVAEHALALMPLAALHHRVCLKNPPDRRPKALGAVDHTEQTCLRAQPPLHQLPQKRRQRPLGPGPGLNKPQHHLFALNRDAQGNHHEVVLKALAVQDQAHEVIPLQGGRSQSSLSLRALARMKRRETAEGESPKASGAASAHPS